MDAQQSTTERAAGAAVLLWLITATAAVRVAAGFLSNMVAPAGGFSDVLGEGDPTLLWPIPAVAGAIIGVVVALAGLVRRESSAFRVALAAVIVGSLAAFNNREILGDRTVSFAAAGVAANAQSLLISAAAVFFVCACWAADAFRQQEKRKGIVALFCVVAAATAFVVLQALELNAEYCRSQSFSVPEEFALVAVVALPMGGALFEIGRRTPWLAGVSLQATSMLAFAAALYWGREVIEPVTPRTALRVSMEVGHGGGSPWSTNAVPVPSASLTRSISPAPIGFSGGRIDLADGLVYVHGVAVCEQRDCAELLTEALKAEAMFKPMAVVFAAASTPVAAVARVIHCGRDAGVNIEVGVIRQLEQVRPVFGQMTMVEAGIVPGAAARAVTLVGAASTTQIADGDGRTWADWLAADERR